MAVGQQLVELFVVQGLEQVMAAQDLVMDSVKHHGYLSSWVKGKGANSEQAQREAAGGGQQGTEDEEPGQGLDEVFHDDSRNCG
nr:hypothetical protein FFPRI1PSEUD_32870 [Pseudomonas sp. FFPRI_1]